MLEIIMKKMKKLTFTVTVISHSGNVVQYFHYSLDTNSNNVTRTITPRGRRLGCSVRSVRVRVCVCVLYVAHATMWTD